MKQNVEKDTVIGVLRRGKDLPIAVHDKWYRIPVKSAPIIVRDKKIKYLALYQGKQFKEYPSQIQWYGEVKRITVQKRIELFPEEIHDPKANEDYYKIELAEMHKLPQPIKAIRPRRINFIITAFDRFIQAKEINDVFLESPIEEKFWEALKSEEIDAERQYIVDYLERKQRKFFCLDFAIFCKTRNIDLECNGDKHHYEQKEDIKKDQRRNRTLTKKGWAILRYPKDEIDNKLKDCILELKDTVDKYGGLQDKFDPTKYRYISESDQLRLF
jgi:very-short-patch-repair endonuclease